MNQPTIMLAADIVLFSLDEHGSVKVLVVERGEDPFRGKLALPGGYVKLGETCEQTARRELTEETGLVAPPRLSLVGVYDAPERDPRGRIVSVVYGGYAPGMPEPLASDDAPDPQWMVLAQTYRDGLAVDHGQMIAAARARLTLGIAAL